jgi:nudix-type nucleoside diphosphatase (YffH/AdpP family)
MRDVKIEEVETLSDQWASLKKYSILYTRRDGRRERLIREVHDHGSGAGVLPYDARRGTVLLVRQFRLPAFLAAHTEPLIEVCAGLLDGDDAETCARREAEEELGYRISNLTRMSEVFVSPGAITERLTLFLAEYTPDDRLGSGGGHEAEGEEIEVLEMSFAEAWALVESGTIVDAKTVILLLYLRLRLAAHM